MITAIYTVLVAGNDLDEPIADEVRGLRRRSHRARSPARAARPLPADRCRRERLAADAARRRRRARGGGGARARAARDLRRAPRSDHARRVPGRARSRRSMTRSRRIPAIERLLRQRRDEAGRLGRCCASLAAAVTGCHSLTWRDPDSWGPPAPMRSRRCGAAHHGMFVRKLAYNRHVFRRVDADFRAPISCVQWRTPC